MPWHPRTLQNTDGIVQIVRYILEIKDPRVVVILSGEKRLAEVERMGVRERVRVCVPAAEAEIEAADAGAVVVDHNELLVMRPVFDVVFGSDVVGVAHACDVRVESFEGMLHWGLS
jgi:hypothetical protein